MEKIEQEINLYLSMDHVAASCNVLAWWQIHEGKIPLMANVAKQILCVPASSTPSERAFSKAGQLITERRALLAPSKVDMVLFLNQNYKL